MSNEQLKVRDVMTADVVTLQEDDRLATAQDVMSLGRIRHMPVTNQDGELVGIVSQRDLFHNALLTALGYDSSATNALREMALVEEAMQRDVVTVAADAPLSEAARLMLQHKIGCLVIVDAQKRVAGILTEADFVALYAKAR